MPSFTFPGHYSPFLQKREKQDYGYYAAQAYATDPYATAAEEEGNDNEYYIVASGFGSPPSPGNPPQPQRSSSSTAQPNRTIQTKTPPKTVQKAQNLPPPSPSSSPNPDADCKDYGKVDIPVVGNITNFVGKNICVGGKGITKSVQQTSKDATDQLNNIGKNIGNGVTDALKSFNDFANKNSWMMPVVIIGGIGIVVLASGK